jgi:hypothetical protein
MPTQFIEGLPTPSVCDPILRQVLNLFEHLSCRSGGLGNTWLPCGGS